MKTKTTKADACAATKATGEPAAKTFAMSGTLRRLYREACDALADFEDVETHSVSYKVRNSYWTRFEECKFKWLRAAALASPFSAAQCSN